MVDVAGGTDDRHKHGAFAQLGFHSAAGKTRPVSGNTVAADGIAVVDDVGDQQSQFAVAFDADQRNFGVNGAFGAQDIGVEFAGVGHHAAGLHPVAAVENKAVVVGFALNHAIHRLQISQRSAQSLRSGFGDLFAAFFAAGQMGKTDFRTGVGMSGAEKHVFFAEHIQISDFRENTVDKQLTAADQIHIDDSGIFAVLLENDRPNFQTVKNFVPDTDVEVTGQRNRNFRGDVGAAPTAVKLFAHFICLSI